MFDEVSVVCPHCGHKNIVQSKAGSCLLSRYTIVDVPDVIKADIQGVYECDECGESYGIRTHCYTEVYKP